MPVNIVGFDEVRLPERYSFGAVGGSGFSTTILSTAAGFEQRNENWEQGRGRWDLTFKEREINTETGEDFDDLIDFWYSRRGKLRGFRFKDWVDFSATAQVCAQKNDLTEEVGDGVETEFQMQKTYSDEFATNDYKRLIFKPSDPESGTLQVFLDTGGGPVQQTEDTGMGGDYTLNRDGNNMITDGIITFAVPPDVDDVVTWTGDFDVPVRFDVDDQKIRNVSFNNLFWENIPIVEIRIPDPS